MSDLKPTLLSDYCKENTSKSSWDLLILFISKLFRCIIENNRYISWGILRQISVNIVHKINKRKTLLSSSYSPSQRLSYFIRDWNLKRTKQRRWRKIINDQMTSSKRNEIYLEISRDKFYWQMPCFRWDVSTYQCIREFIIINTWLTTRIRK